MQVEILKTAVRRKDKPMSKSKPKEQQVVDDYQKIGDMREEYERKLTDQRQIIEKAKTVRRLQREYFKTRERDILTASKREERELDRMLEGPADD